MKSNESFLQSITKPNTITQIQERAKLSIKKNKNETQEEAAASYETSNYMWSRMCFLGKKLSLSNLVIFIWV